MLTTVDETEFLFEWDLQDIDLSQVLVNSPEFSFQDSKYFIRLEMSEGEVSYRCTLTSVETLSKSGVVHFRFLA
jgi:hypothetical protein